MRLPGCHNSNPEISPFSHKTTAAVESLCPWVRKQCCSGNFRASPPMAFWSPEPKCHTSLHSQCTLGTHTCLCFIHFVRACASWKGGLASYYTDTRCQQANIWNINSQTSSAIGEWSKCVAIKKSGENLRFARLLNSHRATVHLYVCLFLYIESWWVRCFICHLMRNFWASQADLIPSVFRAAYICLYRSTNNYACWYFDLEKAAKWPWNTPLMSNSSNAQCFIYSTYIHALDYFIKCFLSGHPSSLWAFKITV